jgi:hypothetical protein
MDYWNIIWFIVLFYAVVISIILLKNGKDKKKNGEDFAKLAAVSMALPLI